MDIVSHGLWGGVAFGRMNRRTFWLAIFFGMVPDLSSFGVYTVARMVGISPQVSWQEGPPPMHFVPEYVHTLYNISHSLITFAVCFAILWWVARKYALPFLAYGLHILVDIPTHSSAFFPTPFLWPLSTFTISGIPWSMPVIFIPNVVLLISAYIWWYRRDRRHSSASNA